eukprot:3792766-Rhodomonas_salina.3
MARIYLILAAAYTVCQDETQGKKTQRKQNKSPSFSASFDFDSAMPRCKAKSTAFPAQIVLQRRSKLLHLFLRFGGGGGVNLDPTLDSASQSLRTQGWYTKE